MRKGVLLVALLVLPGCQTGPSFPTTTSSCSFDQVWDTAIASFEGARLESADKAKGVVESAWIEVEGRSRAGALQREVNKERIKYVVQVKHEGAGASATVQQLREAWSPMGVLMRQWRAIPADASEEKAFADAIARRLKEKGC